MYREAQSKNEQGKPIYQVSSDYIHNRTQYLLERKKRGRFLYANFPSIRNMGITPHTKTEPLRPNLGDHEHIASTALRIYSALCLSPLFAHEFYKIGKIIGYSSIAGLAKAFDITPLLREAKASRTINRGIGDLQNSGLIHNGCGIIEDIEVGEGSNWFRYKISESCCGILKSPNDHRPLKKPCNCIEVGLLCGQAEALFGGVWGGSETRCAGKGDSFCEIELRSGAQGVISALSKSEYRRLLDKCVELAVSTSKDSNREIVGDNISMSFSQAINYLMLSTSKGHTVLSKWAGKKVGEKMIAKAGKRNLFETLDFLKGLFLDLRIGLMDYEAGIDAIRIRVHESVYSAGVENIGAKLCVFLAGMIEGGLWEATRPKRGLCDEPTWLVRETKCTANGDSFCEFECRHKDPLLLKKMLLG